MELYDGCANMRISEHFTNFTIQGGYNMRISEHFTNFTIQGGYII